MFKKKDGAGQESLFNVMKAYSVHDREVRPYCLIVLMFLPRKYYTQNLH